PAGRPPWPAAAARADPAHRGAGRPARGGFGPSAPAVRREAAMGGKQTYRPSRFTVMAPHDAGGAVIYNSLRGSVFHVREPLSERVHELLHNRSARLADEADGSERSRLLRALAERGYVVPEDHDEQADAARLRETRVNR